jgi:uncharacterized protein (DUF697 family)
MGIQDMLGALDTSGMSDAEQEAAAKALATKCAYGVAALTLIPIPLTEVAGMSIHIGMVVGIGHIYGAQISRGSATQLLLRIGAAVGLSYVGTELAVTAGKLLIPFIGSALAGLAGAPLKFAVTIGIGAVARAYFKNNGELSDDEIKRIYKDAAVGAKAAYDPTRAKSSSAKELAEAAVAEAKVEKQGGKAAADPAAAESADPVARLERLKALLDKGLIEQDEYDALKKKILDAI